MLSAATGQWQLPLYAVPLKSELFIPVPLNAVLFNSVLFSSVG